MKFLKYALPVPDFVQNLMLDYPFIVCVATGFFHFIVL